MRIDEYFQQIQQSVAQCPIVQISNITYEKRGTYEGFIRGELHFIGGSLLHLREFVDVETTIERVMYAYQYMTTCETLVFRYDNTGHHKKLGFLSYPHHKHDGSEEQVVASNAPDLVLRKPADFCVGDER